LARPADLLRQRSPRLHRRRDQRTEAHRAAPQQQRNDDPAEHHHRPAAYPGQRDQARILILRQEVNLVAARQLRRGDQQPAMIPFEQRARAERYRIDDGDAAAADTHAHGMQAALLPTQRP
jgi:hypothetical protein